MDLFFKCISLAFIAVTIIPIISQKDKLFILPLVMIACCIVLFSALEYLKPVVNLLYKLQKESGIDSSVFLVLIKITGIGLISDLAILICSDSGNSSLGKSIGIMSSVLVLWLSVPLIEDLMNLIGSIMNLQ